MGNLAFAVLFVVLPIASFVIVRSITWIVASVTGSLALAGMLVTFGVDHDYHWTWTSLQIVTLVALLLALFTAVVVRRGRPEFVDVPLPRQLSTVIGPVAVGLLFIAAVRLIAAPKGGLFTAVGFIIQRQSAEDNAKWLDFTGQLVTGHDIAQAVPMGGSLQLYMVIISTMLAAVSMLAFGGVNEVFVASNAVVYAEFVLVAFAPFALAPLAEARVRIRSGSPERGFIPAPLVWTGILVLAVGSLAVSGLGHLTLQFVFQTVTFWVCVFLVGTRVRHAYALSSITVVAVAVVWFPLTPISLLVVAVGVVILVRQFAMTRPIRQAPWLVAAMWLAMIVLTWTTFANTIRFMTDMSATTASGTGGGGGVHASVPAFGVFALDLLTSQGGTQTVAPVLGVLAVLSTVLAVMFIAHRRSGQPRYRLLISFGPALLLGGYALVLSVVGTWWAGTGPAYGALKTTFLATIVLLAVTVPLALMEIDRKKAGVTMVRLAGIAGVIYLLTIDGLMPHAFTYISPQQWPAATGEDRGYWWPAEVKSVANQAIADAPIACAYFPQGAKVPTALPNGQTPYSCTRMLVGLSGADSPTKGQPLSDWLLREWLTNQGAWLEEYPGLSTMPQDIRNKKFILFDVVDKVTGLEPIQTFLDREKPDWAK
jgi:hypothetical protein